MVVYICRACWTPTCIVSASKVVCTTVSKSPRPDLLRRLSKVPSPCAQSYLVQTNPGPLFSNLVTIGNQCAAPESFLLATPGRAGTPLLVRLEFAKAPFGWISPGGAFFFVYRAVPPNAHHILFLIEGQTDDLRPRPKPKPLQCGRHRIQSTSSAREVVYPHRHRHSAKMNYART